MRPTITKIQFINALETKNRKVIAHLSDGGEVHIIGVEAAGQKSFEQYKATVNQMWATIALAVASVGWLHGDGPAPDPKRFVK